MGSKGPSENTASGPLPNVTVVSAVYGCPLYVTVALTVTVRSPTMSVRYAVLPSGALSAGAAMSFSAASSGVRLRGVCPHVRPLHALAPRLHAAQETVEEATLHVTSPSPSWTSCPSIVKVAVRVMVW